MMPPNSTVLINRHISLFLSEKVRIPPSIIEILAHT
jgi:hypothetical protein